MNGYRRKRRPNWIKWIAVIAFAALAAFALHKYLFPPIPRSLTAKGANAQREAGPISFSVSPGQPAHGRYDYGGFFVRLDNTGHSGNVSDLLFFDRGKTLLSASHDGTVRVWDVTQKENPELRSIIRGVLGKANTPNLSLAEMRNMYGRIRAMALSADGTYFATAAASRVRFYNLRKGCQSGIIGDHSDEVTDLAFSTDDRFLASSSLDGTILVYDLDQIRSYDEKGIALKNFQLRFVKRLNLEAGPVREIGFLANRLAAVGGDGSLWIFECRDFSQAARLQDPQSVVVCAGFSPSGDSVLAGTADGRLLRFAPGDGQFHEFARLAARPQKICFSAAGRQVLVAGGNGSGTGFLRSFSFPEAGETREFPVKSRLIGAIAAADGERAGWWASTDDEFHEITVWDENGEPHCSISAGAMLVKNVQLSASGTIGLGMADSSEASRSFPRISHCFDAGKLSLRPAAADDPLQGAILANDRLSLLTLDRTQSKLDVLNGLVKLRITQDGETLGNILGGPLNGHVHNLLTFAGKHLIVCGGSGGLLLVYDVKGNLLGRLAGCEGDIVSLAGSFVQPRVVASASDHTVRMWSLQALERLAQKERLPGEDVPQIVTAATSTMSRIGAFRKEADAVQAEMSRLFLEDIDTWYGASQYLRLLRLDILPQLEPSLSLVVLPNWEWLAWNPQGYVGLSSPSVMASFGYQADYFSAFQEEIFMFLPFPRLYDKMFRPDLVMLSVDAPERYREFLWANKADSMLFESLYTNPPPEVEILAPTSGQRTGSWDMAVRMRIRDTGGGIGDVRLYHNGKLIRSRGVFRAFKSGTGEEPANRPEKKRVISGEEFHRQKGDMETEVSVRLVPGKNTLSCVAMNYRNTIMSAMKFRDVFCSRPPKRPRLFALAIGINNFQDLRLSLTFTHADALGVSQMLRQNKGRHFSAAIVKTLLDTTKEKISRALEELRAQMDPMDTFVFYASTHGSLDGDRFRMVTADCDGGELNAANSISSDELMAYTIQMPALQQAIILDTCFAGSSSWTFNDLYETRLQQFSLGAGLHLLSATSPYQFAAEGYNQHGFFSFFLIKALEGEADYFGNRDGMVSVLETARYIRDQIRSTPVRFSSQSPLSSGVGVDIILIDRLE